jgi:putative cardiolipin synthase
LEQRVRLPGGSIIGARPIDAAQVREEWLKLDGSPAAAQYLDAVRATPLIRQLLAGDLALEWSLRPRDPRRSVQGSRAARAHRSAHDAAVRGGVGNPLRQLDLVSPYFVPTEQGVAKLNALVARGVKVRVLTNSLACHRRRAGACGLCEIP